MTVISEHDSLELRSPIQKLYAGQNIFITGGTGFLGKLLIEKLLRTCYDLRSIYLLIRPKKDEDVEQRVHKIFEDPVFDRIKKERPKYRDKIIAVSGDCSSPGLGLSVEDRNKLIEEISIVFYCAATVKFDEPLKEAIKINVGGPKEMMELCRSMHNLKVAVHVSTAYSNCNRRDIDEKIYEPPMTGDKALQLVDALNEEKLNSITETLLGDFPNTYTYTKCIAEQVVQQYGKDLPVAIFRPAIVISTYNEPFEGWVGNVNGPTGALIGVGAGLIRTFYMDEKCTAEMIPADYTINALVAIAFHVVNQKNKEDSVPVYNYHSSWENGGITWGRYLSLAFKHGKQMPVSKSIWCYTVTPCSRLSVFSILTVILHIIPALFIDAGLFVVGKRPRLLKAYKKIHKFLVVTGYFSTKKWKFSNKNTEAAWYYLSPADQELFPFSMKDFDWDNFMFKCVRGVRTYIFKDELSTLPRAKKRMSRILFLHRLIKYGTLLFASWFLYRIASFVFSIGSTGVSTFKAME